MDQVVKEIVESMQEWNHIIVAHINMMYQLEKKGASQSELESYRAALETLLSKERASFLSSVDEENVGEVVYALGDFEKGIEEDGIISEDEQYERLEEMLWSVDESQTIEESQERDPKNFLNDILERTVIKEANCNYNELMDTLMQKADQKEPFYQEALKAKYRHLYDESVMSQYKLYDFRLQTVYRDYCRGTKKEKEDILSMLYTTEEEFKKEIAKHAKKQCMNKLEILQVGQSDEIDGELIDTVVGFQSFLPMLQEKDKQELQMELEQCLPNRYINIAKRSLMHAESIGRKLGYYETRKENPINLPKEEKTEKKGPKTKPDQEER